MRIHGHTKMSRTLPIARAVAQRQLAAMDCEYFELGLLRRRGEMLLHESMTEPKIRARFTWLRRENAHGGHVFIRPQGASRLTLIDDLSAAALEAMKRSGFEPAVVVETSSANFQAWLKHESYLERELAKVAARELARRWGGDLSSATWRHFGRLAGFTNQKPRRRLPSGLPPFVRVQESSGRVFSQAGHFFDEVKQLAERERYECAARLQSALTRVAMPIRSLKQFQSDPRYGGDLHRADMAWATCAALHGVPVAEIAASIADSRDLSKKGGIARQLAYARRTAAKAIFNLSLTACPPAQNRQ
jgi:hypothetical protein